MYVDYVKMLLSFNDGTLYDSVNNVFSQIINETSGISTSLVNIGYQMKSQQYLVLNDINVDTSSSGFSFCFWLYPVNPGQVQNPVTKEFESLRMPIITFSEVSSNYENSVLSVYERTNINGTNTIEFKISSYDEYGVLSDQYVVYSDSYETEKSHHFFFNISVEKEEIEIYIDGELSMLHNVSGTIPVSFNHIYLDMAINKISESSYAYNLANNSGTIDDIGFFNTQFDAESILYKIINEGLEDFSDLTLRDNDSHFLSALFDDPTTLKINAMIDDMSYVYLARNDGKILFGSPLFWESRRIFSNSDEEPLLEDFLVTEAGDGINPQSASINNGFLKISDSIIKF